METIESVKQQIELNTKLLSETKERLRQTTIKLSETKNNAEKMKAGIEDLKAKRQQVLARGGGDLKGLNDNLKKFESELELENETCKGLEDFLRELKGEERAIELKVSELPKRVSQLQAVEIAARYNELASGIAPVSKELNEILFKLDASGCGGKHGRVVYLPDGQEFIETVMRLTFDSEALNLEGYIRKNITCLPYNPSDSEKYFYKWQTHRQDLINNK